VNEPPGWRLRVPFDGFGRVEVSAHARDRMEERKIDLHEFLASLADERKLVAIRRLANPEGVRMTIGRITFVVATCGAHNVRILSVWWRGQPPE
jgi:phosphopantetheine adenylyltransferase